MKRGRIEKVLAMLKGGHNKFWGSFDTLARSFSHTEWVGRGGGAKRFHPLKGGWGAKSFTLS